MLGLQALFAVLRARKIVIALSVLFAAVAGALIGALIPERYESTAKVQVDVLRENLLTGFYEPRLRVAEFLGQQSAVAGSRAVALLVYDRLVDEGAIIRADFIKEWREETGGELAPGNDARLWSADRLREDLFVEADELESTVAFTFRSDSPAQAARVANAFADAYMETVLTKLRRSAARKAANFEEETRALESDITKAQRDLTEFRENSGIVAIGEARLEDVEVELTTVTLRLAEARADLSEMQSLLRQANAAEGNQLLTLPLPEEAQSGRQAQSRLGAVISQVQRLEERYGPKYPPLVEALNEKAALQRTILKAVEDRAEFAARRVASLEATAAEKKDEVVKLQEIKQQYDVLSERFRSSRETYDLVSERSLQASFQSRADNIDVFMLAQAVPAEDPVTWSIKIIVAIGAFLGFLLGAAAAVAVELFEGKIRTNESVARILRAPVLGEVAAPAKVSKSLARMKARAA